MDSYVAMDVRVCQETWTQQSQGLSLYGMSRSLIIHCHGGGFVAQSSASHQVSKQS